MESLLLLKEHTSTNKSNKTNCKEIVKCCTTTGLRRLNDKIEIHHIGLKALEVNANTYVGIIVPAILGKLLEAVKLKIMLGNNYTEWKMEDLLKELLSELELREEHCRINKSESNHFTHSDRDKRKRTGRRTEHCQCLVG